MNIVLTEVEREQLRPLQKQRCGQFRQAVRGFFHRLDEFGQELASLLTLNFHLIESQTTS